MTRFPAANGFQAGIVAIMVVYAVITLIQPINVAAAPTAPEAVQDEIAAPPSKAAMDELMQQKLTAAQGALEAVAREDYEQLQMVCSQMVALSHKEVWEQMASPRFVQDTADFVATVEFMDRMAATRDREGVALGFIRMTMACTDCHHHMRTPKIAERTRPSKLAQQNYLVRVQPDL